MVRGLRLEEFAGRFIAEEEELDAELGQRKILGCSELRDRREHRQHGIAEAQVERDDRGERFVGWFEFWIGSELLAYRSEDGVTADRGRLSPQARAHVTADSRPVVERCRTSQRSWGEGATRR